MKGVYYFMLVGLAIAFLTIILSAAALFMPTGIDPDNTVVAIPNNVKAGTLVKYKINGCIDGKHRGVTSVNIQSVDSPPSITVAVAAPAAQSIFCQNVILIPSPLPSGDYRLIVFVNYEVNPVRNLFNPERRQYISNIIHVTNDNPQFRLPDALPAPITDARENLMIMPTPQRTITNSSPARSQPSTTQSTPQSQKTTNEPSSPTILERVTNPINNLIEPIL